LSLSIYQSWSNGDDAVAYRLLGASVALAFAAVWASEWFMRHQRK
jgi:ABC-type molybdate transport system permease subunit